YPERIGKQLEKHGERYKMTNGRIARLPQNDALHRDSWLAIAQVDAGNQEGRIFLAAALDEQDLVPLAVEKENVSWDPVREMVTAALERRIGNLVVDTKPLSKISEAEKIQVLSGVIRENGLSFLGWNEEQRSWQARVASLRKWRPDEPWPDVSDETLLQTVESWLGPFLDGIHKRTEIRRLDLGMIVNTLLPWELNAGFQHLAPPRLPVPSGSLIK